MALTNIVKVLALIILTLNVRAEDDLEDFEFLPKDDQEMMIAQESRQYQTIVKPPVRIVKPSGVTNSHRPQYNLDSLEQDLAQEETKSFVEMTTKRSLIKNYRSSTKLRSRESMLRDAVLRALERKEQVGKLAQVLPIIRAMSESQRAALASLVASQVSTPPGREPLNLVQVRSMFGNNVNSTSDLMLPILLDMANLIRRAVRSGKEPREVKQPLTLPQAQMLRRSFVEDEDTLLDDELFDTGFTTSEKSTTTKAFTQSTQKVNVRRSLPKRTSQIKSVQTNYIPNENVSVRDHNRTVANSTLESDKYGTKDTLQDNTRENSENITTEHNVDDNKANMTTSVTTGDQTLNPSRNASDVGILDLTADSTNHSLAQDLPVAEKLRALNRFIDRKGNLIRRGTYPPKPTASRRTTVDPTLNPISKRRPPPARKLPVPTTAGDQTKCELFTNSLCLYDGDYPTEAILQSIRRNKAAAGALLADFKNPGEGTVDGVTADQEAKYTAEHYLVSNRRGDTASRDFASAGEAGFMCPSSVKYARPQRARATSGQWKYIVNTGEHTQTLRLEKCLKPKEPCTYLTENFKSKCVQVYNYHRLLTWDQQNGLHMDIFKVPTCCSCHIEGYSVSFPPLGHRIHETSSEQFSEDVSAEHGNHAFEAVQSSVQRPSVLKTSSLANSKPLDTFFPFSDVHNLISGIPFSGAKFADHEELNSENVPSPSPMDSYGNSYFPDSFNQGSSIRNVKRPPPARNPVTALNLDSLASYLEPPTPSASSSFGFIKENQNKYKVGNHFKRGAVRPNRRPIRKKIAGGPDDLISSGTSAVGALETMEDFSEDPEVSNGVNNANRTPLKSSTIAPKLYSRTTEKTYTVHNFHEDSSLINNSSNSRKINYNYHPIIDFFEDGDKEIEDDSIDREDSFSTYVPTSETDWKPINHPTRKRQVSSPGGQTKT